MTKSLHQQQAYQWVSRLTSALWGFNGQCTPENNIFVRSSDVAVTGHLKLSWRSLRLMWKVFVLDVLCHGPTAGNSSGRDRVLKKPATEKNKHIIKYAWTDILYTHFQKAQNCWGFMHRLIHIVWMNLDFKALLNRKKIIYELNISYNHCSFWVAVYILHVRWRGGEFIRCSSVRSSVLRASSRCQQM